MTHSVIVGMGAAGFAAAETIRRCQPGATIAAVADDPHGYYSRPGLAYALTGEVPEKQLFPVDGKRWAELGVERISGRVMRVQPSSREVILADGRRLTYDALLLATGAQAVEPDRWRAHRPCPPHAPRSRRAPSFFPLTRWKSILFPWKARTPRRTARAVTSRGRTRGPKGGVRPATMTRTAGRWGLRAICATIPSISFKCSSTTSPRRIAKSAICLLGSSRWLEPSNCLCSPQRGRDVALSVRAVVIVIGGDDRPIGSLYRARVADVVVAAVVAQHDLVPPGLAAVRAEPGAG